jgi:hypothetical protein
MRLLKIAILTMVLLATSCKPSIPGVQGAAQTGDEHPEGG